MKMLATLNSVFSDRIPARIIYFSVFLVTFIYIIVDLICPLEDWPDIIFAGWEQIM